MKPADLGLPEKFQTFRNRQLETAAKMVEKRKEKTWLDWTYAETPATCCKCGKIIRPGRWLGREGELSYCYHCGRSYDSKVFKFQDHFNTCSQCSPSNLCPMSSMLLEEAREKGKKEK